MPSNISFFVAVVAGYLFNHIFYFTRFRAQRLDGYRLLIECACYGLLIHGLARFVVVPLTGPCEAWIRLHGGVNAAAGVYDLVLAATCPIVISIVLASYLRQGSATDFAGARGVLEAWRRYVDPVRKRALRWAMESSGNDLLRLLHQAANLPPGKQLPLMFTLDTGKVYVGYVVQSPTLRSEEIYLSILPVASGHRDDKQAAHLDVFYDLATYDRQKLPASSLVSVIPYASIRKAHFFVADLYRKPE